MSHYEEGVTKSRELRVSFRQHGCEATHSITSSARSRTRAGPRPSSRDGISPQRGWSPATNRAINASYGEVTGITQTVRNYGSALGLAVLGTVLGNVFASRLTDSFVSFGVPPEQAAGLASSAASSGGQGSSAAMAGVPAELQAKIGEAVANDFAAATQAVLIGMAIVLVFSLIVSLLHPGGRVTEEKVEVENQPQPAPEPS